MICHRRDHDGVAVAHHIYGSVNTNRNRSGAGTGAGFPGRVIVDGLQRILSLLMS